MEAMTCELSPLVYAELYRILSERHANDLSERLHEIDLDDAWLNEASEAYRRTWEHKRETSGLKSDHALLGSWLLAGIRDRAISDELTVDLWSALVEQLGSEADALTKLNAFRPVVMGATLGMVVPNVLDSSLPAVPARNVEDIHIAAAYDGIVEHVLHLAAIESRWPEMVGSALFIRGTGLAESLRPEAERRGPEQAINALLAETRRFTSDASHTLLRRHWSNGFVDKRNAVAHILPALGKPAFRDVAEDALSWEDVRLTVRGITQWTFQKVSEELEQSREVNTHSWELMRWDLFLQN